MHTGKYAHPEGQNPQMSGCGGFVSKPYLTGLRKGCPLYGQVERIQFTSRRRSLTSSLVQGFVSLSLWLCGGFHFFRLFANPAGNRSFELQDEPFLSNDPATVR